MKLTLTQTLPTLLLVFSGLSHGRGTEGGNPCVAVQDDILGFSSVYPENWQKNDLEGQSLTVSETPKLDAAELSYVRFSATDNPWFYTQNHLLRDLKTAHPECDWKAAKIEKTNGYRCDFESSGLWAFLRGDGTTFYVDYQHRNDTMIKEEVQQVLSNLKFKKPSTGG